MCLIDGWFASASFPLFHQFGSKRQFEKEGYHAIRESKQASKQTIKQTDERTNEQTNQHINKETGRSLKRRKKAKEEKEAWTPTSRC